MTSAPLRNYAFVIDSDRLMSSFPGVTQSLSPPSVASRAGKLLTYCSPANRRSLSEGAGQLSWSLYATPLTGRRGVRQELLCVALREQEDIKT